MQRTVFNFFFGGAGSSVVAMGTGGVSWSQRKTN